MERSLPTGRARRIALVAAGGFAGATSRHAVVLAAPTPELGTLAVNVAGSFALGILLDLARRTDAVSRRARLLLGTGFLSSFTTYSTFAAETAALAPRWAVATVAANYALGFLAVVLAGFLGRWAA
ncbi:fluoride efflux transporter FluC [Halomicrobium urmianum]|uniref:fluoride efflux transporter FluC n=1 Tax=Halomicrobium urmianum TaxID=1586233 RepID=UPI001CDA2CFD|nr:CrcB family protein [Halomicrobium urmianum]